MTTGKAHPGHRFPAAVPPPLPLPQPELVDATCGVRLRPWSDDPGDITGLVAAWRDPSVTAGNPVPADTSPEAARRWIRGEADHRARRLALDLVISPLDDLAAHPRTGRNLVWGEVGLRGFDPVARRAEVGWWLAPEARGHGIAAAAVDLLAGWALAPPLDLRQVWARTDPAGVASGRVAERAGFRLLGTADGRAVWARARVRRP
jgi:RimJ/RimL family protein N-acetyltransferase